MANPRNAYIFHVPYSRLSCRTQRIRTSFNTCMKHLLQNAMITHATSCHHHHHHETLPSQSPQAPPPILSTIMHAHADLHVHIYYRHAEAPPLPPVHVADMARKQSHSLNTLWLTCCPACMRCHIDKQIYIHNDSDLLR